MDMVILLNETLTHTKTNIVLCHAVCAVCCDVSHIKYCFVCICVRMVCMSVVISPSNYLLQPSDNNGGLIKAKPGGVYTLVLCRQLPLCPQSTNRTGMMVPIRPRNTEKDRV